MSENKKELRTDTHTHTKNNTLQGQGLHDAVKEAKGSRDKRISQAACSTPWQRKPAPRWRWPVLCITGVSAVSQD